MSVGWQAQDLLLPITPDRPCGENLEYTLLLELEAFRLFGQGKPLDEAPEKDEKRVPKPPESPEWREIRDKALEALARSKDLRLLAHLGTALLRTDGVVAFSETIAVASEWLERYWIQTYPLVDEDVTSRRNALNCFADPMAVVDGLRRLPLVRSREHGTFSLRDVDIATGQLPAVSGRAESSETQINAAFASMPLEDLTKLHGSVVSAIASLRKINDLSSDAAGPDATPNFEQLMAQLARMNQVLRAQLAVHPAQAGPSAPGADYAAVSPAGDGASASGVVKSRQDAIRALDTVADFFRRTEPSSPIPLFLARAKRLVSKDFLEVLEDIAPDAVAQARAAGGLKPGE